MLRKTARSIIDLYETVRWKALMAILFARAWMHRRLLPNVRYVGITGSVGKTTTKDIASEVLSILGPTVTTTRSRNRSYMIAEQILDVTDEDRFCVMEMSAHQPGALNRPLRLVKPDIAVLTKVGRDHYRAFKSVDAIAEEKGKLIRALPSNGVAVLNCDDARVRAIGESCRCRIIWVGEGEGATLRLQDVRSQWPDRLRLSVEYEGAIFDVHTQFHGKQLTLSVLSALGVGLAAGVPLEKSIPVIEAVAPTEGRMQEVRGSDGVVYIRDDWKAPHWTKQATIDFLSEASAPRKIAVVGSLSDFSADSSSTYKAFARELQACVDLAVFVGPHAHRAMRARESAEDRSIIGFGSVREAAEFLRTELREGDLVLLKGSAKADHLVRIMLHRYQSVQCWRERCRREYFCTQCSLLYKPTGEEAAAGGPGSSGAGAPDDPPDFPASSDSTVAVIAGLGNPGTRYRDTVHNVGQRVLDAIADRHGGEWIEIEEGLFSAVSLGGGREVLLFKPSVPVNRNGENLARFLVARGSNPDHCVIVHDDTDIEFGKARFKRDGGDGGHKGVRSVITALGTDRVGRVRVGVRRPGERTGAADRVLEAFSAAEEDAMNDVLDEAAIVLERNVSGRVEVK